MKRFLSLCILVLCSVSLSAKAPEVKFVELTTNKGKILFKLYNETPLHRDNFIKLIRAKYFEGQLFHRVIANFMIQGGDPDSKGALSGQALGNGGPDYTIPAEIQDGLFHKKGALGAARDDNPGKESSGSQFYFVQGKVFSEAGLDSLETLRMKGRTFSAEQRQAYTSVGGTPHLDFNYTVFGELVAGFQVVDAIAAERTDKLDRPEIDQFIRMRVLSKGEAKKIQKLIQAGKLIQ